MLIRHKMKEIHPPPALMEQTGGARYYYICKECRVVTTSHQLLDLRVKGHKPYDGSYGYLAENSPWMEL